MRYLVPARKLGDAWQFRMQTPAVLAGKIDPRTGTPLKTTIKRGLGTSHLPTARRLRDELVGYIRGLERQAAANPIAALDDDAAARWRQAIADHEANSDGGQDELDVRGIALDMAGEPAAGEAVVMAEPGNSGERAVAQFRAEPGRRVRMTG